MSTQQQLPSIADTIKYTLYAKVEGSPNSARLVWSSYKGMPRITVFTGIEGDSDKGIISIPISFETMCILLTSIEEHARSGQNGEKRKMQVYLNIRQPEGQPVRTHVGDIYFGKNDEGVTWISIVKPGRPKIVFEFLASPNIEFFDVQGNPMSKGLLSTVYVKGAVEYLKSFYDRVVPDTKAPRENAPRSNAGPSFTPSADFGADIEF